MKDPISYSRLQSHFYDAAANLSDKKEKWTMSKSKKRRNRIRRQTHIRRKDGRVFTRPESMIRVFHWSVGGDAKESIQKSTMWFMPIRHGVFVFIRKKDKADPQSDIIQRWI